MSRLLVPPLGTFPEKEGAEIRPFREASATPKGSRSAIS